MIKSKVSSRSVWSPGCLFTFNYAIKLLWDTELNPENLSITTVQVMCEYNLKVEFFISCTHKLCHWTLTPAKLDMQWSKCMAWSADFDSLFSFPYTTLFVNIGYQLNHDSHWYSIMLRIQEWTVCYTYDSFTQKTTSSFFIDSNPHITTFPKSVKTTTNRMFALTQLGCCAAWLWLHKAPVACSWIFSGIMFF